MEVGICSLSFSLFAYDLQFSRQRRLYENIVPNDQVLPDYLHLWLAVLMC